MSRINNYTEQEITTAKNLREAGLSWKAISRMYGGTAKSWSSAVWRHEEKMNPSETKPNAAYAKGAKARENGMPKFSPYPSMTNLWAWWMAGYNDFDRVMI